MQQVPYVGIILEQMQFIWQYYPEKSNTPHEILDWLIIEAQRIAFEDHQAKLLDEQAYARPNRAFVNFEAALDYDEDDDEEEEEPVYGFRQYKSKTKSKKKK